ncbi:interferon-induced protein 44-like [Triplophysa dalaica]|uniref:interferon-induced protein 44-like n=1 Tax=Triplophysa dalaica TaxID=1582913 RepID=UPI0024E01688|nr:interferon-induced protein 44-like [Triplophysa dalaica]
MGAAASNVDWSDDKKENLLKELNTFQPGNSDITLRILLYGPVGAGKSSFINSVDSALQGRITNRALTDSDSGECFTQQTKAYDLNRENTHLPFTLIDTKGIEHGSGMNTDEIFRMLQGHVEYRHSSWSLLKKTDKPKNEKNKITMKDKIHCLVAVLPANKISSMEDDLLRKMREVRLRASDMEIPQVIIMTKVDEACPHVKYNIRNVYASKDVKLNMERCQARLGVPMCYIYPIKNYHDERTTNTELDILILNAVLNIVNFASDYVKDHKEKKTNATSKED